MYSKQVRLQSSLLLVLTTLVAVPLVAMIINPTIGVVAGVLGFACLYVNLIAEWGQEEAWASRVFARNLAVKSFGRIFGIKPPSKKDWLAMKVCQKVVSEKLSELKRARNALYKEENERVSVQLTPADVGKRIAENRELHSRVEVAKRNYDEAKWFAEFFHFRPSSADCIDD